MKSSDKQIVERMNKCFKEAELIMDKNKYVHYGKYAIDVAVALFNAGYGN